MGTESRHTVINKITFENYFSPRYRHVKAHKQKKKINTLAHLVGRFRNSLLLCAHADGGIFTSYSLINNEVRIRFLQ